MYISSQLCSVLAQGCLESARLWVFAPQKLQTLKMRASIWEIQLIIECLPEGPEAAHQTLPSVLLWQRQGGDRVGDINYVCKPIGDLRGPVRIPVFPD